MRAKRKIQPGFLALFLFACLVSLWGALSPGDATPGLLPWDKAQHFLVFYVLAGMASLALPASRLWRLGLAVLAFGGLIELLQALPIIHRDAEWADLAADAAGIALAYGPMIVGRWRDRQT
ncbi:MAG: hypothetical protein JWP92_3808 [Caulobacter sp.]|nr:hypothetical protein [Caulobacter sp.]